MTGVTVSVRHVNFDVAFADIFSGMSDELYYIINIPLVNILTSEQFNYTYL